MSTHLDGPVARLDVLRPPTSPAPPIGVVLGWAAGFTVASTLVVLPIAADVGASAVLGFFFLLFHLLVTLPLAMAVLLLAISLVLVAFVGLVGGLARIVRPRRKTGAGELCRELLAVGCLVIPGYVQAWRRMRLAWVRGLVVAAALVGAGVFVAARVGWLPMNA